MEFETEMKRLTAELMGAFENRVATVREAQTNTHNQVRANQSTRGAMATQQQGHLHQQMDSLRAQVTELRNTAQQRMRDTYAAHCDMAAAQRQRHTQQMNDLRHSTADYMNHTATARMDMGRAQRNMLGDFMNQLRVTNATFVAETNTARKQASDDKQHELGDFMKALQGDINQMRADTMAFIQTTHTMRAEMSAAQNNQLNDSKAQLTADITVMRHGMQAAQAALRADHDAAHVEWLRFRQAKS